MQTDSTAIGLPIGTYYVSVSDSRGCFLKDTAEVFQPDLLVTTTSGIDANCYGSSDGSVEASPSGGTIPYDYVWDSGCTTQNCMGLPLGTYLVTVSDANNCTTTGSVSIGQPAQIIIDVTTTPVSCHAGSDGTATATVSGGVPGYGYLWPNMDIASTTSGLSAGTYDITVADSHFCPMIQSFTVSEPDTLLMTFTPTAATCFGFDNGFSTVNVTGGVSPYGYVWENGDIVLTADTLAAGFYNVTITDFNNCVVVGQTEITQPPLLEVTFTTDSVNCHAYNDGVAFSFVTGGTPGYSYQWTSGSDSSSAGNLIAGLYVLTITDNNLCILIDSVDVYEPDTLHIDFINTTTQCFNDSTGGTVSVVTGGTIPYNLFWSTGSLNDTLTGLPAGTYFLSVTDIHSCFFVDSTWVGEPDSIQFVFSTDSVNCFQGSDGSAMVTVTGGTAAFTYNWGNGMSGDSIGGLSAGNYLVTVTDANGCTNADHTTVYEPTDLRINVNYGDLTCFESNDGWATVSAIGGTPPYTFEWSTGQTEDSIYNLPAGPYSVTVTDSRGCTEHHSFTILQPDLLVSADYSEDVICYGQNSGIAGLDVVGGTIPYHFIWSNGYTLQADSSIIAGTYFVTITDEHNCVTYDTIVVYQPEYLAITFASQQVLCYNASDGWANISVSGGILPYQILWSTGDSTLNVDSLSPGNYYVQVVDSNSCMSEHLFTITQPDSLYYDCSVTNISCYEFSDGEVTGVVYGGTEPYQVNLYNMLGQSVSFQNLDEGAYIIHVVDSNDCAFNQHIIINQPDTLNIEAVYGIASQDNYGYVDITVSGGTLPYTYEWSTLSTQEDISHLIGGVYIVTVTDDHGCVSTFSANIDLVLTIPNVITPNADGKNDDFEILNLEAYQTVRVEIYNRWGDLLYQFAGSGAEYNNGNRFNGVAEGKNLPMGSYLYIIVLNETDTYNGPLLIKY
jgi:gliding motility-associated-like protein